MGRFCHSWKQWTDYRQYRSINNQGKHFSSRFAWGAVNLGAWLSANQILTTVLHGLPNTRGEEVAWAWPKSKSKRILLREQHAVLMMSVRIHVGSSSQDYNNHNRCMYLQYSLWPKPKPKRVLLCWWFLPPADLGRFRSVIHDVYHLLQYKRIREIYRSHQHL